MTRFRRFLQANLLVLFLLSALGNVALGVANFVLQPIWRAGAVASAVTATRAKAELDERRAVALAKSREKAKARLTRVLALLPIAGVAAVGAIEYADYQAWLEENPGGDAQAYARDVMNLSRDVADEVLAVLPEAVRPDQAAFLARVERFLDGFSEGEKNQLPIPTDR